MIYIIQSGLDGPIKVGFAKTDVLKRLYHLQIGNPVQLTLLGSIEGPVTDETIIHRLLYPWSIRGEWFESADPVISFIDKLLILRQLSSAIKAWKIEWRNKSDEVLNSLLVNNIACYGGLQ